MGDTAGETADRLQFLRRPELLLDPHALVLGIFVSGEVPEHAHDALQSIDSDLAPADIRIEDRPVFPEAGNFGGAGYPSGGYGFDLDRNVLHATKGRNNAKAIFFVSVSLIPNLSSFQGRDCPSSF